MYGWPGESGSSKFKTDSQRKETRIVVHDNIRQNVIGLAGKLRSGKDTVADYLVEKHGWLKLGMSDPLAEALYALNPLIEQEEEAYGFIQPYRITRYQQLLDSMIGDDGLTPEEAYVEAKKIPEVRRLLQALGTEVGRDMIGPYTWIDIMTGRAERALQDGAPGVVVTGIRFPNEVRAVGGTLFGEVWWIHRPGGEGEIGGGAGHSSENSVGAGDADVIIENAGTLEDLYALVELELSDFLEAGRSEFRERPRKGYVRD